jgi:hypothetical protein
MQNYYGPLISLQINEAIIEFESLLKAATSEYQVQAFLETHAYLILQAPPIYDHYICVSQAKLGSEYQADFALYGSCNGPWWTLIEIERPGDNLFNANGDPSARFVHAMRQTRDWRQWISENREYFGSKYQDHMGLRHCHINTGVIIGRRNQLTHTTSKRLLQMNQENHYDWIMTYDGILEGAQMMKRIKEGAIIHTTAIPYGEYNRVVAEVGFDNLARRARHAILEAELDAMGEEQE